MGLFGKGFSGQKALDFVLGGYAGLDRRNAMERRDKYQQTIDQRGDPLLSAIFGVNPMKTSEALATGYEAKVVGQGDLYKNAIGGDTYNPKTSWEGQFNYAQTPTGPKLLGSRPMTYSEQTAQQNANNNEWIPLTEGGSLVNPRLAGYDQTGGGTPYAPSAAPQAAPSMGLPPDSQAARSALSSMFPQANFTSGYRTPEHNAKVGGVANSMHTRGDGQAWDMTFPGDPSTWPAKSDVMARLQAQGFPATEVLGPGDKGHNDHYHVGWGQKGGQPAPQAMQGNQQAMQTAPALTAPGIIKGPPKRGYTMATPEEVAAARLDPNVPWQKAPDGQMSVPDGWASIETGRRAEHRMAMQDQKADRAAQVNLRKEFDGLPEVKAYNTVATSYQQIQQLAATPNAANDIALIFSYMRMLDPNSVVREGEFATAQNAASIPDQVRNAYNKALRGERLNPNQRQQFVDSAGQVFQAYDGRYNEIVNDYTDYATQNGWEPQKVFRRRGGQPPQKSPPKKTGSDGWSVERVN